MLTPRETKSQGYQIAQQAIKKYAQSGEILNLEGPGTSAFEAWLLGPKGENTDELERLVIEAVRDIGYWRSHFHPEDPVHVTAEIKNSAEYRNSMAFLRDNYRSLLAFLKRSVPAFSMRYQGHMAWDLAIPGILGYFATMLYNPNNVAFEASTATTFLEMLVGDDLCRMLGYHIPDEAAIKNGAIRPWGHVTCGGSVSNIEALWSARNLKFYPLALQAALKDKDALAKGRDIDIALPTGGRGKLVDLDSWQLLNLPSDDVLALPARLGECAIEGSTLTTAMMEYSLPYLGFAAFADRFLQGIGAPVFIVPGTKHYSFDKAAALMGIGVANMREVVVDLDARMNVDKLRETLECCLQEQRPVITTVAVMGSTEEAAVDPLRKILDLRAEFRKKGLDFTVHADAAWGGYHASLIREDFDMTAIAEAGEINTRGGVDNEPETVAIRTPSLPLDAYVTEQYQALGEVDSITVDPHKQGYIPYPAGALCYRNSAMRFLVTFSAPYMYHGEAEPAIGIYGIEGSKPGAAPASIFLTHRVIRPTKGGYGKLIGQTLFNCKKLYVRLLCMEDDNFIVEPLARLRDKSGVPLAADEIPATTEKMRHKLLDISNEQIAADPESMELMLNSGPDLNILVYTFNLKINGKVNEDLKLANMLNELMYKQLSIDPGEEVHGYNLIVSTSDFSAEDYGDDFIADYKDRLGIKSAGDTITVLRSVVMDPWLTDTPKGSFLPILEQELRKAATEARQQVLASLFQQG